MTGGSEGPAPEPSADEDPAPGQPAAGLGAVLQQEEFSMRDAIGGPRGIAESVLPTLVFITLYTILGEVVIPALAAVGVVVVALVLRLVQRQSPATVVGGLIGVALGAFLAIRSGEGTDFYLPGIVINAVTLAAILVTLAVRRPVVGIVVALLDPRSQGWREDADARRIYAGATWLFAGLYALKLATQVPLLLLGQVEVLGVVKLVLGLPAFALLAYVVWLMHRVLVARREPAPEPGTADREPS